MKKRILSVVMAAVLSAAMLVGCGGSSSGAYILFVSGNRKRRYVQTDNHVFP